MADFVVGDSNSKLVGTCIRRDGTVFDLTGKAINLKFRIGSNIHTVVAATVLSPATAGRWEYVFSSSDLAQEGVLYAEVEIIGA